jgi:hypothetical protein
MAERGQNQSLPDAGVLQVQSNRRSVEGVVASSGIFELIISKTVLIQGHPKERRIYLAQGSGIPAATCASRLFLIDSREYEYIGFCDDFGPMNFSCVVGFAQKLQAAIVSNPGASVNKISF